MTMLAVGQAAADAPGRETHLRMALIAESARPAAGGLVTLAFHAAPAPGWHGYWQNPGDAGVETLVHWTLPAGASAGALRYPVPGRLLIAGLMNYVYERPFAMLVNVKVPAGLAPGTPLPIAAKVDYLVCTATLCVPETQTLTTTLTIGDGAIDAQRRATFDAWRRAIPRPLGAPASYAVADGQLRIAVPFPAAAAVGTAWFYPAAPGMIDMAVPQTVSRDGDRLIVAMKAPASSPHGPIAGVIATTEHEGFSLSAAPGVVAGTASGSAWSGALAAFGGALLGGLLLNIMPCVFPILSLKALSLARSGESAAGARGEALAYTAGVVLVCLALGAALLGLRAGGATVGWAFQLQDPRVVAVLLLLVLGIALNLAGLFELPVPAFAGRGGAGGAFMTGALAAFVATPCTGPFMGAALGAALVLPAAAAMAVFAGLGLGIALPFLLIGFVPALRARLPRPGAWMERLRHVLSVPMFLTALALAWVLGRQAGVDGMTLGLGAALVFALGLWLAGLRQHAGRARAGWYAGLAAVTAVAMSLAIRPATPAAAAATAAGAEPFSEARLAALRAQRRPVFAYFTADWCLTCKVNEQAAIETAGVADAFRRGKVAVLVGDWTDGDPSLGRFIEKHNRAGVPLYLWYAPGAADAQVLPQVLTPAMLERLPGA